MAHELESLPERKEAVRVREEHEGVLHPTDTPPVAVTRRLDASPPSLPLELKALNLTREQRYLKTFPVVAFGIAGVGTWEATANGIQTGFLNGGPASIVWGFLLAGCGALTIVLSLAEMASITPSVGAQYRWTAIYCPSFLSPRFASFIQGWLTVWAWIVSTTLLPFFTGAQVLGLVSLSHPGYVYQGWHATLVGYGSILIPLVANLFARRLLKPIELFGVLWHFIALITISAVLIALGGRNSASFVFTGSSGGISGWENGSVQWNLGMLTAALPLTAFDAALHLSDEVLEPETRVPKSMVYSYLVGWVVAFVFSIILLFFMGDPDVAVNTPAGWPIMEILRQAARSVAGAQALMSMIIVTSIIAYFNAIASVSRLTWAFARDDGLPFSDFFKMVHPTLRVPIRAVGLTIAVTMLLLIIPIGSSTAWNAMVSLSVISLYFSYTLPCLCIFICRWRGEEIPRSPWSLGKWGIWINGIAVVWGLYAIVWLCLPVVVPVTAASLNWSGPTMGFVVILAVADWFLRGRHKFAVPLERKAIY